MSNTEKETEIERKKQRDEYRERGPASERDGTRREEKREKQKEGERGRENEEQSR